MKRYILTLLIAVMICVPLLSLSVYADTLVMGEVIVDETLPAGYVVDYLGYQNRRGYDKSEVMFYSPLDDLYYSLSYDGQLIFDYVRGNDYALNVSELSNLQIRIYPCNGRDIFTFTPDQKFTINVPYNNYYIDSNGIVVSGTNDRIPTYVIREEAKDIPITVEEMAQSHFDYYILQNEGSVIKTSIDYYLEYSIDFRGHLNVGSGRVIGYPVSVFKYTNGTPARFSNSTYYESIAGDSLKLHGYQFIENQHPLPSISVVNRLLNHFGYNTIFYSSDNAQLSNDIVGLGDQMGDFASQAGAFNEQSNQAVSGVTASIGQFNTVFTGVWNVLPSWFNVLLSVVLVIVIGRKILGR